MSLNYKNSNSVTTTVTTKNKDNSITSTTNTKTFKPANTLLFVFFFVAVILIIINFVRSANGSADVSFAGFLSYIKDAPRLIPNVAVDKLNITDDWGIFSFLKTILNSILSFIGVLAWLGASILNMLNYISYFIVYLFV